MALPTPTLSLPSQPSQPTPLELPNELLLALHQTLERDALDAFVLGGGGASGVQVEDVLNELIPGGKQLGITAKEGGS